MIIMTEIKITKPFLKWIGGKTQIIEKLLNNFPKEINNYHEIFLGGGSVLFALLDYVNENKITVNGQIYAYDLNKELISTYKNIQLSPKELIEKISIFIDNYNSIEANEDTKGNRKPKNLKEALQTHESYYYWIRKSYNDLSIEEKNDILGSAMFIFLNKTCFRGMYREGKNGFNVPFGHYENPSIIHKKEIMKISKLIEDVIFENYSFDKSIKNVKKHDFAYLDPPYAPEKATSFVGYTTSGFDLKMHEKLFELCHNMNNKKIKFMMSNANVKLVLDSFPEEEYEIDKIDCRRAINAKNPDKKAKEVIIKNF